MRSLRIFKALADESRLRLLTVLWHFELSVNELVNLLVLGQSRVSRHLKILVEADLLNSRRDGLWVFYSANKSSEIVKLLAPTVELLLQDFGPGDLNMAKCIIEDRSRKTRQFFNTIADDWDTLSHEVLGGFDLAYEVTELMPNNCQVAVDLGCGTGEVLELMRSKAKHVIGVDGSSRMLELSRRRFIEQCEDISLRIGELDHLPLRDNESDFVCLNMVLHHLSDPLAALLEIKRVMLLGGMLVITDFDKHNLEKMRTEYGDRWLGFDHQTMNDLLNKAGLMLQDWKSFAVKQDLVVNMAIAYNK